MNYDLLSKVVSYALRHQPWKYELELDEKGWVSVDDLLQALRNEKNSWEKLSEADLIEMIAQSAKERHELKNGKIRAFYGHSMPNKLVKTKAKPPKILYHGTSPEFALIILEGGLKPMTRQYVHLSEDIETAKEVGYRKSKNPKILLIRAAESYAEGVKYYVGNKHVWLADSIPSKFIEF